jgi:hypothetical protein
METLRIIGVCWASLCWARISTTYAAKAGFEVVAKASMTSLLFYGARVAMVKYLFNEMC